MWGFIWFGAPLVLGTILGAVFAKGWLRTYGLFALGLLLGFGVVVLAYVTSPPDYQHSNGTEGRQYLGRWWDPEFVITLTALSYCIYLVGLGLGAFAREIFALFRSRDPPRTRPSPAPQRRSRPPLD
jgi:hypothetical protein